MVSGLHSKAQGAFSDDANSKRACQTGCHQEHIAEHESNLLDYATKKINEIDDVRIIGNARNKASVLSFVINKIHPHDIGTIMDSHGIAIRAGNHCTQPIMDFYSIPATARASFAIYNNKEDVDKLMISIKKTIEVFK